MKKNYKKKSRKVDYELKCTVNNIHNHKKYFAKRVPNTLSVNRKHMDNLTK